MGKRRYRRVAGVGSVTSVNMYVDKSRNDGAAGRVENIFVPGKIFTDFGYGIALNADIGE